MSSVSARSQIRRRRADGLGEGLTQLGLDDLDRPREGVQRGSQVSLTHEQGYAIMQALIARGVIGDFRAPNIMRFGFAGLYVRYVDIWDAVGQLKQVMSSREWDQPKFTTRKAVT